jgi:uncharacterized phage protein gp47/JayE
MTFIDASGFHKKTLAEIRAELEASALSLGFDDLSPDGPIGQIISIASKREADVWEGAQELYASLDKDQATGTALDRIFGQIGLIRLDATAARVSDVLLWLEFGALVSVASGSQAKASTQPMTYDLESTVAQAASVTGPFRAARLSLDTFVVGNVLSVTLDGTAYTHTVIISETQADALGLLATSIMAGAFGLYGSAVYELIGGNHYLRIEGSPSFVLTAKSVHFSGYQSAQAGIFVAGSTGTQPVPPRTLDTIVTPVSGWDEVEQPADGVDGTGTETDTAFRLRAARGFRTGTATETAIRDALYLVDGVSQVFIKSNRDLVTDGDGRPAKSFEAIVVGGTDADVATAIWKTEPAGILPYGVSSYNVLGADGVSHPVGFSRPVAAYAHVEVTVVALDPDGGPVGDYAQAIKDAVSLFGNANFELGANFTLQKLFAPIYSVPGIYSVTLRIATTATAAGIPSWSSSNVLIAAREYLTFDSARVAVL